jgi:hypothetical protein
MAEISVTLGILAVLVLSMSTALSTGFRYLLTTKQRAAAVAAANALVERARAVARTDYRSLGLVSSDLAGDANIASGTCGGQTAQMFSGEPVVTSGTTDSNPLYPHVRTTNVGSSDVSIKVYVTGVTPGGCSAANPTYKRVTVLANWARNQKGVSNQVRLATFLFDASGAGTGSLGTGGAGQDDDGDGQIDEDGLDGIDNDDDGQKDEDCVSGCGGGGGGAATPNFEGEAEFTGGYFDAQNVSSLLIPPPVKTTTYLTKTTAHGETTGSLTKYAGSAISVVAEAGTQTAEHKASSIADNDPTTAALEDPSPACVSGAWSDFVGGLINSNLVSSGQSCSRLNDPSDQLPLTTSTASFSSAPSFLSTIPAGGVLPLTSVTNFLQLAAANPSSSVDAVGSGDVQTAMLSTSSLTAGGIQVNKFNLLAFNALQGAFAIDAGTWSTSARAGAGVSSGGSTLTGAITYRLYDPGNAVPGCGSHAAGYCVKTVNPTAVGFTGVDDTNIVVLNTTNILDVVTARTTLTTTVSIPAPVKEFRYHSVTGDVIYAKVAYQLPKVTSTMAVESPLGVTLSTITSATDLGQLISWAAYTP